MNSLLIKIPSEATTARHETEIKEPINYRFRFWPYNFDTFGEVRTKVGIPKADFEFWMTFVNGPGWDTNGGAAAITVDQPTEQERPVEMFRPAEPYESVLRGQPLYQYLGLSPAALEKSRNCQTPARHIESSDAAEPSRAVESCQASELTETIETSKIIEPSETIKFSKRLDYTKVIESSTRTESHTSTEPRGIVAPSGTYKPLVAVDECTTTSTDNVTEDIKTVQAASEFSGASRTSIGESIKRKIARRDTVTAALKARAEQAEQEVAALKNAQDVAIEQERRKSESALKDMEAKYSDLDQRFNETRNRAFSAEAAALVLKQKLREAEKAVADAKKEAKELRDEMEEINMAWPDSDDEDTDDGARKRTRTT